jgi:hypothetical protein
LAGVDGRWSSWGVLGGIERTRSSVKFLARVYGRWSSV